MDDFSVSQVEEIGRQGRQLAVALMTAAIAHVDDPAARSTFEKALGMFGDADIIIQGSCVSALAGYLAGATRLYTDATGIPLDVFLHQLGIANA